jgi:protein-tyrosine phosphatase
MDSQTSKLSKRERRMKRKLERDLKQWRLEQAEFALEQQGGALLTAQGGYEMTTQDYLDPDRAEIERTWSDSRINPTASVIEGSNGMQYQNVHGITQPARQGTLPAVHFCRHAGNLPVIDFGNCKIHGAAYYDLPNSFSADLVIDCANITNDVILRVPQGYEELLALTDHAPAPTIRIDWPDHGAPPVAFEFWEKLYSLLPNGKVLVCCFGGHGRTGTALAALYIIHHGNKQTAQDAIEYVKKHHCRSAIETQSQRRYLCQLAEWWNDQIHGATKKE